MAQTNAVRPKNYTDEMVAQMTEAYQAEPTRETVDMLAKKLGKSVRSIIAKLSVKFSAIMPDPTTIITRKALPINSPKKYLFVFFTLCPISNFSM